MSDTTDTPISSKHAGYFVTHRHAMPILEDMIVLERRLIDALAREKAFRGALGNIMVRLCHKNNEQAMIQDALEMAERILSTPPTP